MVARTIIAVLLGVLWVFCLAFFGAMILNQQLWAIAFLPGAYVLTIAAVFAIPSLYKKGPGSSGPVLTFALLTATPCLFVFYVAESVAGWYLVLAVNAVCAVVALTAFRAMGGLNE